MAFQSPINRKTQKGAALLAILMLFIVAASYSLVRKLNANSSDHLRRGSSLSALNEAKAALIGYAVNYPSDHTGEAPGYLPCPDINDNGSAGTSCSLVGGTTIGRIPWKTLELSELRDASGQRLWYAVSDNYKNNPKVLSELNSDSAGNFSVDGNNDIVAIIFAAGVPVGAQNRADDPLDVSNYLEDDNASNGDNSFVSKATGEFNDTIVTISRQELMSAVEKRVLGDIDEALTNYQTSNGAFPWLSPFTDPSTSAYRGALNTWQGHIPFHWSADPDSINQGGVVAGRNPFTTDISLSWVIANATVTNPGQSEYRANSYGYEFYGGRMVTPDIDCVENNICTDGNYAGLSIIAPIVFNNASCTWSDKETFQCTGTYQNVSSNSYPQQTVSGFGYSFNIGPDEYIYINTGTDYVIGQGLGTGWQWNTQIQYAYTETVTRTYTIDLTYTDSTNDGADIVPPTSLSVRSRDIKVDSNDNANALFSGNSTVTITVKDDRQIAVTMSDSSTQTYSATSTRTLTNDGNTTGSISSTGMLYDIDVDGYDGNSDGDYDDAKEVAPELPSWFVENGWNELIYVAYASGEPSPGNLTAGQDCVTLGTTCITANINGTANNDVRAVAISSGVDLNAARPSAAITDYYEGENSNPVDDTFIKDKITATYNDQTRIISTAP